MLHITNKISIYYLLMLLFKFLKQFYHLIYIVDSISLRALLIFMRLSFTQVTQVWMQFFRSPSWGKLPQNEKVHFTKRNKLKLTQVELLSFFIFKSVQCCMHS